MNRSKKLKAFDCQNGEIWTDASDLNSGRGGEALCFDPCGCEFGDDYARGGAESV